jgi:replication factor C small subunit
LIEEPWVEKYRPNTFNEIVSQNIAINNLKEFTLSGNIPHMIFTGPAGTGKTSTALIIAKFVIKKNDYHVNVLELNASDTVRMDYVRSVIKDFVNQNLNLSDGTLKFILLDEADNIPSQVQQALRRIIEKASNDVKFILMCNYINRIIDPIISRCAVFRFVNLPKEKIIKRLKFIASKEKLEIPKEKERDFYETLYFISGGDLRKAINTLQMAVSLELLENLDLGELLKISGFMDNSTFEKLSDAIMANEFNKARSLFENLENLDGRNFIRQLLGFLPRFNINSQDNPKLLSYIGDIDYRISIGSNEKLQLTSLIGELIKYVQNNN